MALNYNKQSRDAFLEEYYSLVRQSKELDYEITTQGDNPDREIEGKLYDMRDTLTDMREQYRSMTPVMPLSRCPFSQRLFYHSFDPYGLDGPWWNYEAPVRPADRAPSRFLALTGAMKLGPVENVPYLIKPGPDAPYVVPELLEQDGVKAVLTQIQVGAHIAFVIVYFAETPDDHFTLDTWGTDHRAYVDHKDTYHYDEFMDDDEVSQDFILEPWISQGKLLWVTPGDLGFDLKTGASGCPYLNIEGNRKNQIIVDGEVIQELDQQEMYEEED